MAILAKLTAAQFKPSMLRILMSTLRRDDNFKSMYTTSAFAHGTDGLGGLQSTKTILLTGRAPRESDEKYFKGEGRHRGTLLWLVMIGQPGIPKSLETGQEVPYVVDSETGEMVRWRGEPTDKLPMLGTLILPGVPLNKLFSLKKSPLGEDDEVVSVVHALDLGKIEQRIYAAAR
jgi:hypothetical protein